MRFPCRVPSAVGLCLVLLAGACGDDAETVAPTTDSSVLPTSSCLWSEPVTIESNNTQYPDAGVAYWFTAITLPAGSTLRLHGEFPHSRYASFNSYGTDPATGESGLPVAALADVEIEPDDGSTNPFLPGADRTAADRSYAVEVTTDPTSTAANPLVVDAAASGPTEAQLIYRVYLADDGTAPLGGVTLPRPEVVTADGTTVAGEAACEALAASGEPPTTLPALDEAQYRSLVALGDPATHPAQDPPQWVRFFNARQALLWSFWPGTDQEAALATVDAAAQGGYYSNAHTDYVVAPVNHLLGPDPDGANVLVLTGRAPTTPRTVGGEPTMGEGQVRYWSLCQNESPVTTRGAGCLYDEQVPVDEDGDYTIVIGRPEDRPPTATAECGVAWLDWGSGDGVDRPQAGTLILRHLLADPSFDQAIARVPEPGTERATMGPYLPRGRYVAAADLALDGCGGGAAGS